ncbi:hypothetical protein VTK56DRAFT_6983 [Thermocarpiscus australiensis]
MKETCMRPVYCSSSVCRPAPPPGLPRAWNGWYRFALRSMMRSGITRPTPGRGGKRVPTKKSASVHRMTTGVAVTEGTLPKVEDAVGLKLEVKVLVDPGFVDEIVLGEGVDVIVLRLPHTVVTKVVGDTVLVNVLNPPPGVDTNVSVMGSVPVAVVTSVWVVSVPPAVVVKLVTGGVLNLVTGDQSMVSTIVVGSGVMVMTVGVPPTLVVAVKDTSWNGAPVGVVTTTCVTGVSPTMSTAV